MAENSPKRISLPHSARQARQQWRELGNSSSQRKIKVSVILQRKQALKLDELAGRQLSREEFAASYGADSTQFDQLRDFAAQHRLTVDEDASSVDRRTIVLEGTVADLEQAFGVEIKDYEINAYEIKNSQIKDDDRAGQRFHSYSGTISVPEGVARMIQAVLGLDAQPIAKPHFRRLAKPGATNLSYTPPQVAGIYSFPSGVDGSGETVGILELGGGFSASDLQTYFQGLNLASPSVTTVSVDGGTNSPGDANGADGEVFLDIEVVGSVASGAGIAVYFAPNTEQGFVDGVTTAVHDTANNPSVLSISWGGPEDGWSQQTLTSLDDAFQSAAALGVTVTVACGDNGSTDGVTSGGNHVDFPASSPHVLACGGTALVAEDGQRKTETVWNDLAEGGGATGGGVSAVFALPSWQANANVPAPSGSTGGRGLPDVSGDASPETGYQVLVDGQSQVIGGTSAVAPLWAALFALLNQKYGKHLGFVNSALYQSGEKGFYDITSGNNGAFKAGQGWDACSGLGSPLGTALESLFGGA